MLMDNFYVRLTPKSGSRLRLAPGIRLEKLIDVWVPGKWAVASNTSLMAAQDPPCETPANRNSALQASMSV